MDKYLINPNHKISKINKDIYGHFAEHLGRCIYEGIYVGENSKIPNVNGMRIDVVNALKDMGIPVLRWPGGCFADEYHWKDGIGDKANRKKMINTHWGGVVEDNSFGTHEYFELCRQLGCDTYINGNVGSGSVKEMNEWVEYMTFDGVSPMAELRKQNGSEKPWKINYFGVGNESWGCGGNMDPEYYGCLYKRYNTYVRDYNSNNKIKRIACGPNVDDYHWTREVMDKVKHHAQGISLHYYTIPGDTWEHKGSATEFDTKEYYKTLAKAYRIEELINNHISVMNSVNPQQWVNLVVDEWGTWYDVEPGTNPGFLYQQNTMRDAMVAALTLNIFNKHSDRIMMANIAQTVNVLQAMILTDAQKMVLTPTYYVFKMFKDKYGYLCAWDKIIPNYTIFHNDDHTFSDCWTDFSEDFNIFYQDILKDMATAATKKGIKAKEGQPANFYCISCTPWTTFTGYSSRVSNGEPSFFPIVLMGKYKQHGKKILMPVNITIAHAVADGYHVGLFFQYLQEEINNY